LNVPIFINCRDRVTPLRKLVAWLELAGHDNITLLDNASTWEPLLHFYRETPHKVLYLNENLGNRALWDAGLVPGERFVYTDPDQVPMDETPLDMVAHLGELLDRYPEAVKAGPGQYWDDLPEPWHTDVQPELNALHSPNNLVEPGVHMSAVDTTFALYPANGGCPIAPALRLDMPYMVRQSSLYIVELDDENRHYCEHAILGAANGSSWALNMRERGYYK
jgi:hypothetical protein